MQQTMKSDNRHVCVIIPAFNEETSVGFVISQVKHYLPGAHVVVIDDGSTDGTVEQSRAHGAIVVSVPFNLGIGGAVQTGLKYAYRNAYQVALEIDADGQHDPSFAPILVRTVEDDPVCDMAIGSRFIENTHYQSSRLRRFGIHTFSYLIKLVTQARIYDSTSGYRAYNRKALRFLSCQYPTDFPEPESIVMLLQSGFTIKEIPVTMNNRTEGHSVIGRDLSFRAAYFVASNAIAILMSSIKAKRGHVR